MTLNDRLTALGMILAIPFALYFALFFSAFTGIDLHRLLGGQPTSF